MTRKVVTLLVVTPYIAVKDDKGRTTAGPGPLANAESQQPVVINITEDQIEDWKWPPEFRRLLVQLVAEPVAPDPPPQNGNGKPPANRQQRRSAERKVKTSKR